MHVTYVHAKYFLIPPIQQPKKALPKYPKEFYDAAPTVSVGNHPQSVPSAISAATLCFSAALALLETELSQTSDASTPPAQILHVTCHGDETVTIAAGSGEAWEKNHDAPPPPTDESTSARRVGTHAAAKTRGEKRDGHPQLTQLGAT